MKTIGHNMIATANKNSIRKVKLSRRIIHRIKNNGAKILACSGAVIIIGGIMYINHSEEYRMAHNLKNGVYAIEPHLTKTSNNSKKPTDLDPTFITKQLATIDKTLRSDNSFIGLVGPNDTGKTLTLQYYASKSRKNSIYCTINPNTYKSLSDSLYQRMYEPLFKLPGILGDIRFGDSRKDPPQVIIERVFRKAALTEKVQVFIDIHDRQGKPQPRHQFDAEHFIHDVKYLVKSVQWVRCMFASVDEFSFDEVDKRESRLVLIRLNNLSANHARHFLNNQCTCKTCGAATFNDGKHNFIDVLRIAESC